MDYEKEYKSLVAKVKKAHQFAQTDSTKSVLEDILPKLRESEDERIRKKIIDIVKAAPFDEEKDVLLDYLEKQKDFADNEYWRGFGNGRDEVIDNPDMFNLQEKQKEQKPASISCSHENDTEWSEEDEKKIIFLERLIEYNVPDGQYGWADGMKGGFVTKSEAISVLKSLRPQTYWKPSEELLSALHTAAYLREMDFYGGLKDKLRELDTQLREQM